MFRFFISVAVLFYLSTNSGTTASIQVVSRTHPKNWKGVLGWGVFASNNIKIKNLSSKTVHIIKTSRKVKTTNRFAVAFRAGLPEFLGVDVAFRIRGNRNRVLLPNEKDTQFLISSKEGHNNVKRNLADGSRQCFITVMTKNRADGTYDLHAKDIIVNYWQKVVITDLSLTEKISPALTP